MDNSYNMSRKISKKSRKTRLEIIKTAIITVINTLDNEDLFGFISFNLQAKKYLKFN